MKYVIVLAFLLSSSFIFAQDTSVKTQELEFNINYLIPETSNEFTTENYTNFFADTSFASINSNHGAEISVNYSKTLKKKWSWYTEISLGTQFFQPNFSFNSNTDSLDQFFFLPGNYTAFSSMKQYYTGAKVGLRFSAPVMKNNFWIFSYGLGTVYYFGKENSQNEESYSGILDENVKINYELSPNKHRNALLTHTFKVRYRIGFNEGKSGISLGPVINFSHDDIFTGKYKIESPSFERTRTTRTSHRTMGLQLSLMHSLS